MITELSHQTGYIETQAYKNYMNEIENMVLSKDKQNSISDNYRGVNPDDFRTGESNVSTLTNESISHSLSRSTKK